MNEKIKILARKTSSKISNSKVLKLLRRFRGFLYPTREWRILIKRVQAVCRESEHQNNTPLVIDGHCLLIPAFRGDGVGIQAMVRICVMFLARQAKATYIHLPFLKIAHQYIDPKGRYMTPTEWAAKWEAFFNLGKGEYNFVDLINATGKARLVKHMSAKDNQYLDPEREHRDILPDFVKKIHSRESRISGIYTIGLGLCRQPRECNLFLNEEFIQILQEKFETNGYKPSEMLYCEQFLNIAIHIRRGDVWEACLAGSKVDMYTNKFVSEEYYVRLLERLHNVFLSALKPVRFHIFSDGRSDDFVRFSFTSEREAYLKLESGVILENIQFHLRQSTIDTLYHLIKAPILVPGKSTYSVVAALLGNSYVFYENEICEFYQYYILDKYMQRSPRFVTLTDLEERATDVMEVLINSRPME